MEPLFNFVSCSLISKIKKKEKKKKKKEKKKKKKKKKEKIYIMNLVVLQIFGRSKMRNYFYNIR